MSPFRPLTRLFLDRYYTSEALAGETGFEANVYALLGIIITVEIMFGPLGPLFLVAYAMGVTGIATAFEWDMLFPDRRDFLVLTPFPIRLKTLFLAKLASLGIFLSVIFAAVHAYIPLYGFLAASMKWGLKQYLLGFVGGIAATGAASLFGFLVVAGLQGFWIGVCSPRVYRRISPWLQTIAMCAMLSSVLLFPVYFLAVTYLPVGHAHWAWWIPPYWFWGITAFFSAHADPGLAPLGLLGLRALGVALTVFGVSWALGFARHYRQTLEADAPPTWRRARRRSVLHGLLGSNEARAIYRFTGQTLARSPKHRLFLATYLTAGISLGLMVSITVERGGIGVTDVGLRAVPALIVFFVVSGFRAAFQFPAELQANWVFKLTESGWAEAARRVARLRVAVSGLLPAMAALAPLEIWRWGWRAGALHVAVQAAAGMLLIEILFYSFDKIPFTCSYYPGGLNLIFLAVAYLYGFTTYSFQIADLEARLEGRPESAALCLAGAAALWAALRRFRRRGAGAIRFEGGEPEIQTLELN
jgi:hypothetical protein